MNHKLKKGFISLALSSLALIGAAQRPLPHQTPMVREREMSACRPGYLSWGERRHLDRQQRAFRHQRLWALRDGHLNGRERAKLYALKRHQRHDLYRFKHNRWQQ